MAPTTPQDPAALSAASMKLDVENKGSLSPTLYVEGSSALSAKQLAAFADEYGALRKENMQMKRGLFGITLLAILLFVWTTRLFFGMSQLLCLQRILIRE